MEKTTARKLIRQYKRQYTSLQLQELSQQVTNRLAEHILAQSAIQTVLLYHSLPDEVFTHTLIQRLHKAGRKVLLPSVVGNDLELHEYLSDRQIHEGELHIQESDGPLFTAYDQIDLAVIPGMAFTREGHRLGRGKGYYDRLLPALHCQKVGLAFHFQLLEHLACEAHDVRMDQVFFSEESIQEKVAADTRITDFQRKVYMELLKVPCGQTLTYGELARRIGCRSAQAVGQALKRNPYAPLVPCHRVVAADGSLGGYHGQTKGEMMERKKALLQQEQALL